LDEREHGVLGKLLLGSNPAVLLLGLPFYKATPASQHNPPEIHMLRLAYQALVGYGMVPTMRISIAQYLSDSKVA